MTVEELFEVFDESGKPCGTAPRSVVHAQGLWHRAANVFLFCADGRLLIQQRQRTKDVCPGLWDLSVAEHLRPGETYLAGALRGLREELGVAAADAVPIGSVSKSRLEIAASGIRDYEFQQSFRVEFDGTVRPDAGEVMNTRTVTLDELRTEFGSRPQRYTPWFRARATELGIVPD